MDHRDPGNAGYAGVPAVFVTGDMVLLWLFLACGSPDDWAWSGTAAWVVGTLKAPSLQGHRLLQPQEQ